MADNILKNKRKEYLSLRLCLRLANCHLTYSLSGSNKIVVFVTTKKTDFLVRDYGQRVMTNNLLKHEL